MQVPQEMISDILQDIYPDMSPMEADAQALEIYYDSDEYIDCLDELIAGSNA